MNTNTANNRNAKNWKKYINHFVPLLLSRDVGYEFDNNADFRSYFKNLFNKYLNCDWGDLCEEDWKLNDLAVENRDDRILARYTDTQSNFADIYIITESDFSSTTILFTDEY